MNDDSPRDESPQAPDSAPDGEERKRLAFYSDTLLKGATRLRAAMRIDEAFFRTHPPRAAARDAVLWTVIDEVVKTAVSLMRLQDLFADDSAESGADGGDKEAPEADAIRRVTDAIVLEDLALRQRRLSEVLVMTVLFSSTDSEPYYRHYLALDEYEQLRHHNRDREHFHGASSENVARRLQAVFDEIHALELSVDSRRAWYASYRPPLRPKMMRLQTTARTRLRRALPMMRDFERFALGTTYEEAFRRPSGVIHFSPGVERGRPLDGMPGEGSHLGLLGLAVVSRVYEILGRPTDERLEQLARALPGTDAPKFLENLNVRYSINVGDFVVAHGFLGEVMEEKRSSYGYRSLRVEFLAERPMADLASDWFRVRDVARFSSRERLELGVERLAGRRPNREECLRAVLEGWRLYQSLACRGGTSPT